MPLAISPLDVVFEHGELLQGQTVVVISGQAGIEAKKDGKML
jgi:hypothetical protein